MQDGTWLKATELHLETYAGNYKADLYFREFIFPAFTFITVS
jgi:hypothetical protein